MPQKSVTGLKRLYRGNSTAKTLLDYFASRDRNRESTRFDRVLSVLIGQEGPVTRARLRDVFRQLERLGYGTFVIGRRGYPTRFEWAQDATLIATGQAARVPVKKKKAQVKSENKVKRGPGRPRKEQIAA